MAVGTSVGRLRRACDHQHAVDYDCASTLSDPCTTFIDQSQASELDPATLQIESMLDGLNSSAERIDDHRLRSGLH